MLRRFSGGGTSSFVIDPNRARRVSVQDHGFHFAEIDAGPEDRADALKAAFTEPSMVAFVDEATEDLDDAGELLKGTSDAQPVLMTIDFYLQYAVSSIKQLEGVLRKFGNGVKTIR